MIKLRRILQSFAIASALASAPAVADPATPLSILAKLPVKEVTVFKDGHAFLLHEGNMPADAQGNVQLDYLPTPVLGTFWPFSANKAATLASVVASQRKVLIPRTALNLTELLEANKGAEIHVEETSGTGLNAKSVSYDATLIGIPERSSQELEETSPPNSGEKLPEKANLVLLKTATGTSAVPIERIQTLSFKNECKGKFSQMEFRNLLTLNLAWTGHKAPTADVGMMYLQKGIRWIPDYKVNLDGQGNASVKLQATLINELTDLDDVTAHLVIGVPNFAFKAENDPIAIQQTMAQLSPYFHERTQTAAALSNAIMSQVAGYQRADDSHSQSSQPSVESAEKADDLFVFTVKHITMKKGQRMVLPVAEYNLKYQDIYTLDIPFAPPPEVSASIGYEQREQISKLLDSPKVMHKIRLANKSAYPLTTAPALIMQGTNLLCQSMMTYTAIGARGDLDVNTALDVKVKKTDKETKRAPNAATWQSDSYARVDLAGTISLSNYTGKPIDLEIKRRVLGSMVSADHDAKISMINVFEENKGDGSLLPVWWRWFGWPAWWAHVNGMGESTWELHMDNEKTMDLNYTWHYFWR